MEMMSRLPTYLETTGDIVMTKLSMLLVISVCGQVPCELEVFNLFSGLIPQAGLARMDKQRQRQAMVPDMKISLTMGGVTSPVLHELKVISSNQTRYKPSWKERGVDKRSAQLHDEYVGKASRPAALWSTARPDW